MSYGFYNFSFELVEWTGRCIREDKKGAIPAHIKPLFERFNINEDDWLDVIKDFNRHYISAAGNDKQLASWAAATQKKWCATHLPLQLYQ